MPLVALAGLREDTGEEKYNPQTFLTQAAEHRASVSLEQSVLTAGSSGSEGPKQASGQEVVGVPATQ